MTAREPARETAVTSDGYVYDVETGEVLGLTKVPEVFQVADHDSANFVLKIRSKIEGGLSAIDARAKAAAVNFAALRAVQVRRLTWWDRRFGADLIRFAKGALTGKGRTVQFDWGKVSFRRTAPSRTIVDMDAAVAFVQEFAPKQVRTVRSVILSGIDAALLAAAEEGCELLDLPFLTTGDAGDKATITTGI